MHGTTKWFNCHADDNYIEYNVTEQSTYDFDDLDVYGHCWVSGTSFAAPHAAGFFADIISRSNWQAIRNRPHVAKALMMAIAENNPRWVQLEGGSGAGLVKYTDLEDIGVGSCKGYVKEGPNSSLDTICEHSVTLEPNKYVRVVLAWLNDGGYAYTHGGETNMDLDLMFCPSWVQDPWDDNEYCQYSHSLVNAFEVIDLSNGSATDCKFYVNRVRNSDTSADVRAAILFLQE